MSGTTWIHSAYKLSSLPGIPNPLRRGTDDPFDSYDEFAFDTLPMPDEFLESHDVLAGTDHTVFHRLTRELFEGAHNYHVEPSGIDS